MVFNEFFSIFYVFYPSLTRPLRFLMYYYRVILYVITTAFFTNTFQVYYIIAIIAVMGQAVSIVFYGIKTLIRIDRLKSLAVVFLLLLMALASYACIIYSPVTFMTPEQADNWALNFITGYVADFLFLETISCYLKLQMITEASQKYEYKRSKIDKLVLALFMDQHTTEMMNEIFELYHS